MAVASRRWTSAPVPMARGHRQEPERASRANGLQPLTATFVGSLILLSQRKLKDPMSGIGDLFKASLPTPSAVGHRKSLGLEQRLRRQRCRKNHRSAVPCCPDRVPNDS